ncbi:helix-turn-helix transcriptional regulator [Planctomicrobium piriforme]|uniref:AraC-type DNA-binding protein n=1 Tax=Planctomicrobium piriforme TaxID=1576369 RepID=A0A1I3C2P7_9PLAN|nr:AraC family transcriptional regulator [Planctomicrobium piriforme]SFH68720.1 AraC-type DNA-binding protein [Planctomicrobium piriforme]
MDAWDLLLPLLEIETVERLTEFGGAEETLSADWPVVYAVAGGDWTFAFDSVDVELRLHAGDVLVVTKPVPHRLHLQPTPGVADASQVGATVALAELLRMRCRAHGHDDPAATSSLPPTIHLHAVFMPMAGRFEGADLTREVAQILVSVLLATQAPAMSSATLSGVDPEIAQAILAMERTPAKAWTIQRLASEAGISRSALAQKFKEQTGQTPSDYLLNIRMKLADEMLRGRRQHLKEIARLTGYQSVSAFSTAFKRWSGSPPSVHRKQGRS